MKVDKISKVKSQMLIYHAFFASLLLRLECRPEAFEGELPCPTMGTDGRVLIYNEKFVESLDPKVLTGVFIHEIYHIVLEHHLRMGNRESERWNMATDYAINLLCKQGGFDMPKDILYNEKFKDMNAEEIYKLLEKEEKGGKGKGKDGKSGGQGCAKVQWNIGGVMPKKGKDGRTLARDEIEQESKNLKGMIKEAYLSGKLAGKLPADLERMLKDLLEPKINWKEALAKFISVHVLTDYTWSLPDRAYVQRGFYLPTLAEPELGDIVMAVDTSGSITDDDLRDLVSEVRGILIAFPTKTFYLIGCDTHVASVQEVNFSDEIKRPKGGGGTCYREPFKWVKEHSVEPVCFIYLTDGECNSFPDSPPDYPVLWVLTKKSRYYAHVWEDVKFGEVVIMDKNFELKNKE